MNNLTGICAGIVKNFSQNFFLTGKFSVALYVTTIIMGKKVDLPEKAMKTPMAAVKSSGAEPPAAMKVAPATSSLIPPLRKYC